VIAVGVGIVIANQLDLGHPAASAILLATGSAAIVLSALAEARRSGGARTAGDGVGDRGGRGEDRVERVSRALR
jgi:hypothetical protein